MNDQALRDHVVTLLTAKNAHVDFEGAIKNIPVKLRGKRPQSSGNRAAHSLWEVLEHLRIATWDILEFTRDARHVSPDWPSGYWPKTPAPPSGAAWNKSAAAFRADLKAMCELVANPETDLFEKIAHGSGQTVLREALVLADHNAYHYGELVVVRRLLGAWKD